MSTIVVAGTREADAYRIAREKLSRIVANLAPEAFETLFSRVMSLVPPEELAGALSASPPWPSLPLSYKRGTTCESLGSSNSMPHRL